jgi:hypothetical protein
MIDAFALRDDDQADLRAKLDPTRIRDLSTADLAALADQVADDVRATEDPALRARLAHCALVVLGDELGRANLDRTSPEVHSAYGVLLNEHADLAEHLDVNELAVWLGRNYSADDERPRVPLAPYITILGSEGLALMESEVARIERFGGRDMSMSTTSMLRREIALQTADAEAIIREFGGSLMYGDQYLGVARAFQLVRLPLQAEVYARRGSRLTGPSALACHMIALEFAIGRDPVAALPEIEQALLEHPTREVASMVRRAIGDKWNIVREQVNAKLAQLPPADRRECEVGLGQSA